MPPSPALPNQSLVVRPLNCILWPVWAGSQSIAKILAHLSRAFCLCGCFQIPNESQPVVEIQGLIQCFEGARAQDLIRGKSMLSLGGCGVVCLSSGLADRVEHAFSRSVSKLYDSYGESN
jgi:hypothetical protein